MTRQEDEDLFVFGSSLGLGRWTQITDGIKKGINNPAVENLTSKSEVLPTVKNIK